MRVRMGKLALGAFVCLAMAGGVQANPERGGALKVIIDHEPASLDPIFGNYPNQDRRYFNLFSESLVIQDRNGNVQPRLATSWRWLRDGRTLEMKLRDGVQFHDGTMMNAEAVKFNIDRARSPEVQSRARQYLGDVDSVEVVDRLTVRINLKRPSGAFMAVLAGVSGTIMSPTAIKSMGAEFARKPVGTGPFKVDKWTSGKVDVVRFPGYWGIDQQGQKLPYLDRIEAKVVSNSAVKLIEIKGGGAHLIDSIQVKDFDQVERTANLKLVDATQGIAQILAFNNAKPPFDNIELRKAVSYGIDRQALEKVISRGEGVVLKGLEPPTSWAFAPDLAGHPFDPKLAREAYAKSGHTGPITLIVIQRDPDTQIAQMLQAMLKESGITLRIEVLERQAWVERTLRHDYQMGILRSGLPHPDPDITYSIFYGRDAKQNYSGVSNPKLWDLIDNARSETVQAKRRALYGDIQKTLLNDFNQSYLFWRPAKEVQRAEVQGVANEFAGSWLYEGIWLKK